MGEQITDKIRNKSRSSHTNKMDIDISDGANSSDTGLDNDDDDDDDDLEDESARDEDDADQNEEAYEYEEIDNNENNGVDEDQNNSEEQEEDDEDIDKAIAKADKPRKQKEQKRSRQFLNQIVKVSTFPELQLLMRKAFQEAQTTIAVHKRQLTILKTIMFRAHTLNLSTEFNNFFCQILNKVLPVKKNIKAADRIVKFVSSFFLITNPTTIKENNEESDKTLEEIDEIYSSFVERILKYLVKGLDAMNTTVRYRICHLLSHIIGNCGGIDEELYELLSDELTTRIYDKDSSVRIKAIAALACFQNDDRSSLSLAGKKIRFAMQNDLNSEVRRTCLKNIEKNRFTEPYIVERARDVDTTNRRLLYSKVLPAFHKITDINSQNRTKLLEWGLRDREESVRKAASNWLTETWMQDTNNDLTEFLDRLNVTESDIADTAVRVLLDKKPEVVDSLKLETDFFENLTPALALLIRIVFEYCQDNKKDEVIDKLFPEAADFATLFVKYFRLRTENLMKISENREGIEKNPDLAVELGIIDPDEYNYIIMQLLKIAVDYDYSDEFGRSKMYSILRSTLSNNTVTEPILPLLMECLRKLAINERDFCQMTVEIINDLRDTEYERIKNLKRKEEEKRLSEEAQILKEKRKRRKGINDENSSDEDNDEVEKLNIKVQEMLKENSDDDDDDENESEDEYHSALNDISRQSFIEANKSRQEELDQVSVLSPGILTDCLTITKCMLQLVFSPLKENMLLISLLDNFIIPCVNQRSEVAVRELALTCHGLCGLLDKEVAISTMVVAGIFVTRSDHESFVVTGLQVIGDLLTLHGISILESDNQRSIDSMAIAKVFYRTLKDESKPEAQTVVAITLFKLFLCDVIDDDELFETTLLTYFNPKVNKNIPLKQCLTFCIPTYAFSRDKHQELIASIVYDTIERLFKDWNNIVELNNELEIKQPVTSSFIIDSLLYWTDPYNLALSTEEEMESSSLHLDVGIQLMRLLRKYDYYNKVHKILYKPIIRSLTKLTFTSKADINKLREFSECFNDNQLCQGDLDKVLDSDMICKNNFLKCHTYIQECLTEAEKIEAERLKREGIAEEHLSIIKDENEEKELNKELNKIEENKEEQIEKEEEILEKEMLENEGNIENQNEHGNDSEKQLNTIKDNESSFNDEINANASDSITDVKTEVISDREDTLNSDSSIEIVSTRINNKNRMKKKMKIEIKKENDVIIIKKEKNEGRIIKPGKRSGNINNNHNNSYKSKDLKKIKSKKVKDRNGFKTHKGEPASSPPSINPDTSEIILLD